MLLDLETLEDVKMALPDPAVRRSMLDTLESSTCADLKELETLELATDRDNFAAVAHRIAGRSRQAGALKLGEESKALQLAAMEGVPWHGLSTRRQLIASRTDATMKALREFFDL